MKKFLFILLCLIPAFAYSQQTIRANEIIADQNLYPPVRDTVLPKRVGELRFRVADNSLYTCISMTPGTQRWAKLFSGTAGWGLTGNTGTNPSTNWFGTNTDEVNASLLIKVAGEYGGFIRRTKSNDSTTPTAPNHGFTSYGQYAGDYIIGRITSNPEDSSSFMLNQTLYGYQAGRRLGVILPSDRVGATPSDENLFIGPGAGRWTRISSGIYFKGRNTIVTSGYGFFRNISGSYNTGLGQFVLELNNAGNGNSAGGDGALRSNIDGDFNATWGGSGMLHNSTGVYTVSIPVPGTGYTIGDPIIFSAPLSNGPGTCVGTATGVVAAVDGSGGITLISVTYPGCGYVQRGDSCFYVGTCHPAVTATAGGSGTGASLVPVLRSGSYNTGIGILNGSSGILNQYMIYVGYESGYGTRYWDNNGTAIGRRAGVHSDILATTAVNNWIAFGQEAKVRESNTAAYGDSTTYALKHVFNGTIGDSAVKVNGGIHVTGGVRFSGINVNNRLLRFTSSGNVIASRFYDDGTYSGVDDVLNGTVTNTGNWSIFRNYWDGDPSSNWTPHTLIASQSSLISNINMLWIKAPNMPSTAHVAMSIGKNNTTKNSAILAYHWQADNSNLNNLEVQFTGVNNAMRIYPNRHVTIGNISAESGYSLEVETTSKFRDTVFNLAPINLTKAGKMVRIVDTATGAVYRIPFDSVGGSGGGGITTLAAIGSSANANGATILGSTLNLEPASGSFGGVVTTVAQTFAGAKTFSSFPTISAATSGRVPYFTTAGLITDASTLTYDGTDFLSSGTGSGNVGLAARNTTSTGRATLKLGNDNSPIAGFIFINGTAKTDYGGANSLGFLNINNAAISFHTNNIDLARLYIGGDGNIGFGTESPTSTLQNTGSTAFAFVTKTVAYTATSSDYTIYCDATSAAFTITLPASSGCQGRIYVIKKTDASGNAITVDGNASETIDGATTYSLATQYKYVTIQSDGSNWFVIGNN